MSGLLGHVGEFKEEEEEWPQYAERVDHYFAANGVADEKKVAVFLSLIGPKEYKLLSSLIAPTRPGAKTYKELVDVLKGHHSPEPSEIVQRYRFHTRFRKAGETVAVYVSELRALAQKCNFEGTLENMLRDRLVCGVNNDTIQRRLLAETKLSFKKALELAQSLEAASKNMEELSQKHNEKDKTDLHRVQSQGHARGRGDHRFGRGKPQRSGQSGKSCYRCGKDSHLAAQCPYLETTCFLCGKKGHLKKLCRSGKSQKSEHKDSKTNFLRTEDEEAEQMLHHIPSGPGNKPFHWTLVIEGKEVTMELDTGAGVSLVSEETYRKHWPGKELHQSTVRLRTYTGEPLEVLGEMEVKVIYEKQTKTLPLAVVKGSGPSLIGRNWLTQLSVNWGAVHEVKSSRSYQDVLDKYPDVFKGLGTLKGHKAKIHVDQSVRPRFCKARSLPYAMRDLVEQELDRLVSEGILEPVTFAEWAAPIVPVLKADKKTIRICGDFKKTINEASKLDRYPIPRIEDLLAQLAGGKHFTKLDMSQAYQQVLLEEESKDLTVINTHRGLFRYARLPFGISSAPGIFQRIMESLLKGIPGVVVYIDDILITGKSDEQHLAALEEVLRRLDESGLKLKLSKCSFMRPSVVYLGYLIDEHGVRPVHEKVEAIQEAPAPRNVTELKAYLGMLTYYSRFLPNMSTKLAPLYNLLHKDTSWTWNQKEQEAFRASKELLLSAPVLAHFDSSLELSLACDASAYGIGAVLSQTMSDGQERPVGFVSRTLSSAEKNYSQLEKEGLACVFGVARFRAYLLGHHFDLITDHKPLLALLGENRAVPESASGRIQRWSWALANYEYTMKFRPTQEHSNADALSRLPLPQVPQETLVPAELVLLMESLDDTPVTAEQIKKWTSRNAVMSQVLQYIRGGWPKHAEDEEIRPYWNRRLELSVHNGCVIWGNRVVVPPEGREQLLRDLHSGHPGVSRMKSVARMFVWWPGIDSQIEKTVQHCGECQLDRPNPPQAPLHPWSWPTRPWTRIHLDYAGPCFANRMFLVVIDAHSKWLEVYPMTSSSSSATIQQLRVVFAQFGVPETVVTDNGSCFTSDEFSQFLSRNGIVHLRSAPYHPSTNGLAERAVQIFKRGVKKMKQGTLLDKISRFLLSYRTTPQTTTGCSPAELLFGRSLRTRLDLVRPNLAVRVEKKQREQKKTHDSRAAERDFQEGEEVYARDYSRSSASKWTQGKVLSKSGPVSYRVECEDGIVRRYHQDQIRKNTACETMTPPVSESEQLPVPDSDALQEDASSTPARETPPSGADQSSTGSSPVSPSPMPERRYPTRTRNPPDRFSK